MLLTQNCGEVVEHVFLNIFRARANARSGVCRHRFDVYVLTTVPRVSGEWWLVASRQAGRSGGVC